MRKLHCCDRVDIRDLLGGLDSLLQQHRADLLFVRLFRLLLRYYYKMFSLCGVLQIRYNKKRSFWM